MVDFFVGTFFFHQHFVDHLSSAFSLLFSGSKKRACSQGDCTKIPYLCGVDGIFDRYGHDRFRSVSHFDLRTIPISSIEYMATNTSYYCGDSDFVVGDRTKKNHLLLKRWFSCWHWLLFLLAENTSFYPLLFCAFLGRFFCCGRRKKKLFPKGFPFLFWGMSGLFISGSLIFSAETSSQIQNMTSAFGSLTSDPEIALGYVLLWIAKIFSGNIFGDRHCPHFAKTARTFVS
jgi:hypothetical protein